MRMRTFMPETFAHAPGVEHPAPHRSRVSSWSTAIALALAPAAWGVQLLLDVSMSGHACFPKDVPLVAPAWDGLYGSLLAVNAGAILLCVIAGRVAWINWQRTREERAGSADRLLASGDGRTRFLALIGLLTSALFGLAVIFESINVVVVSMC